MAIDVKRKHWITVKETSSMDKKIMSRKLIYVEQVWTTEKDTGCTLRIKDCILEKLQ